MLPKFCFVLALVVTVVAGYQVEEDEITFYLYNSEISDLKLTKDNLCAVDPNKDIHLVAHGRGGNRNISFVTEATETYLQIGDYNVIQVDWSKLGAQPNYVPRDGSADAGYYIAKLIRRLHKRNAIPLERFNLVGHSLGAQIISFAAKHVKTALNAKVKRCTGLDRANEVFSDNPALNGLYVDDADVVAVLHTDDLGLGNIGSVGTIDLYANGGLAPQPGCDAKLGCSSHGIVTSFFIESLQNPEGFLATKCDSYENYLSGACDGNDKVPLGGDLEGKEGDYHFLTNPEPPYSKENATVSYFL